MAETHRRPRKNARAKKPPKLCEACNRPLPDRRMKWCNDVCKAAATARKKADRTRQRAEESRAAGVPVSLAQANAENLAALKMAFLIEYEQCGIIGLAAERIGRKRRTINDWAAADATFRQLMLDAKEEATDRLVREASRRAVDGVHRPMVYRGEPVTDKHGRPIVITEYSDRLLELLLRANRPGEFGTDRQQIVHSGQVAVAGKGGDVLERVAEYADALAEDPADTGDGGEAPGDTGGDGPREPMDTARA